jgi:hypothetical protein
MSSSWQAGSNRAGLMTYSRRQCRFMQRGQDRGQNRFSSVW